MAIIGLKSLSLRAAVNTPQRAHKKRVFTEDEYNYLCTLPVAELRARIGLGDTLIGLLSRPEMMNMIPAAAAAVASNLRFQQDEIRNIIKLKEQSNGRR